MSGEVDTIDLSAFLLRDLTSVKALLQAVSEDERTQVQFQLVTREDRHPE